MLDYYDIDVPAVLSTNVVVNKVRTELQQSFALCWQQSLEMSRNFDLIKLTTLKWLPRIIFLDICQSNNVQSMLNSGVEHFLFILSFEDTKIPKFCKVYERHAIEDEKHFLLEYSGYKKCIMF